jgi:SAM-dependent methyltransferase
MWGPVPFGAEQYVVEQTASGRWARRLLGELHYGVRLRGYYLARALNGLDDVQAILDAGCGYGQTAFYLRRRFSRAYVRGVDICPESVAHCQQIARYLGYADIDFALADLTTYSDGKTYDLIVCFDVLEHILDWEVALLRLVSLLRPGGWLVIHTPHRGRFQNSAFGLRRWFRSREETIPAVRQGHVREGFLPEDFCMLEHFGLTYEVTYTFGPLAMWAHTLFEAYRGRSRY